MLTPHPGEMARLTGKIHRRDCRRTAWPRRAPSPPSDSVHAGAEGRAHRDRVPRRPRVDQSHRHARRWARAARGDMLTGMIAGLLAQFPRRRATRPWRRRSTCTAWRARSARAALGEKCLIATDHSANTCRTPWRSVPTYRTASEEETIALANGWRANCRARGWCC